MAKKLIFVLGGVRSGKSRYALKWVQDHGERVLFVATAQAYDDEMDTRITQHQTERPADWDTLETPLDAGRAISDQLAHGDYDMVLLDCMTMLASNALLTLPESCDQNAADRIVLAEAEGVLAACERSDATWMIISNEVGMGVVPPSRLGRLYRDALGKANQRIALVADEVLLLVAGLPWSLRP